MARMAALSTRPGAETRAPDIRTVTGGGADGQAVAALVWEFFDFLRERYAERCAMIDSYVTDQRVAEELDRLAAEGPSPGAACLLARHAGAPAGTLMLKPVTPALCEMNRMYVRPAARGLGIGRSLVLRLMDEARGLGYSEMRLEALDRHVEALPLYHAMGFAPDPEPTAYARETPGVISLRRAL